MAELIWSPRAVAELDDICRCIARDSPRYTALFAQRVFALVETIGEQPRAGRVVPEYQRDDLRESIFQNYRIVYRIKVEVVEIVSIVHGARLLSEDISD